MTLVKCDNAGSGEIASLFSTMVPIASSAVLQTGSLQGGLGQNMPVLTLRPAVLKCSLSYLHAVNTASGLMLPQQQKRDT